MFVFIMDIFEIGKEINNNKLSIKRTNITKNNNNSCLILSNKVPLAIHDYRHGYPELPKHPVPKEDVTAHSSPLFHPPKSQSSLQPMIPEPMPEIESSGKLKKFTPY